MKLSASNLKGMNFKQIMVQHGEKAVLGLAVVIALLVIVNAKWSTFNKTTPTKLKESAETAAQKIKNTEWPADEKLLFPEADSLAGKLDAMRQPIDAEYLKPRIDFSFEPYYKEKKHEDPKYFAVEQPVSTAFRALVSTFPEETASTTLPGEGERPKDAIKQPGAGRIIVPGAAGGNRGPGGMGAGIGMPSGAGTIPMRGGKFGPMPGGIAGARPGGIAAGPAGMGPAGMGMGMGEGGVGAAGGHGRGYHVVAFRGIYPLNRQLTEIARALNLPSDDPYIVRQLLKFHDTIVERRISADRGKTWGKWQPMDIKAYAKFLQTEIADYDPDVVDLMVTEPHITSPLPARLLYRWGTEPDSPATHPALAKFALTPEGRKAQLELQEALAKQQKLIDELDQKSQEEGGFAPTQRNWRELAGNVGKSAGARSKFEESARNGMEPGEVDPNKAKKDLAKVTAAGHLLLFRYFDFNVEPGLTYTYRVRLKLRNPNFRKNVSLMAPGYDRSVNEEFKLTPFSEATKPVFVPFDVKYFLTRAEAKRSRRFDLVPPTVDVMVYQWFSEFGTMVKGQLRELSVGQVVQGKDKEKVVIIEPAKPSYTEDDKTQFSTNVTLIDIDAGTKQLSSQSMVDELGLSSEVKGRLPVQDEILVVDQLGKLKILDPLSNRNDARKSEDAWKAVATAFEGLLVKTGEGGTGSLEDLEGMPGVEGGMPPGAGTRPPSGKSKGKGSALRPGKGGRRRFAGE